MRAGAEMRLLGCTFNSHSSAIFCNFLRVRLA
jgi:hypothetical protein